MKLFSNNTYLIIATLFLGSMLSSCGNKENTNKDTKSISPELVTNPITASGKTTKSKLPHMEFKTEKHDFGLIVQGVKVSHTFRFKNTGGADLIISSASSTCGCTVPNYSKEPIKPGENGQIEVVFSSANIKGAAHKQVKILTNAQPNTVELTITAEIYVPEK